MSKLKTYRFSDIYEISSGISSKPEQAGHGKPFLSFSTVFNNYFLPNELPDLMDISEEEENTYSIREGDVFLTRTSETLDELGMSSVAVKNYPKASYSGFLKRIRPTKHGITYPKFMAFYLRSKLFRKTMNNNAIMTLRASFNEQIFSYLELILPEFNEQKKIGDLLYAMNQKIELNNKINAELEGMAKLIYEYWFVQFDFPFDFASTAFSTGAQGKPADDSSDPKDVKPYKSSGGKMVWNKELKREIPEGWEVKTLDSVCERIQSGGTPLTSNKAFYIGNLNWFTTKELQDEYLIESESTISEYAIEESSAKIFEANTVVIAIYAAPTVGRIGILTKRSAFNQACCGLTPGKSISSEYLFQTLILYRNKLNVLATGTTQKNLGVGTIKNQKIVIPQEMVFNKYNSTVTKLFKKKRTIVYENQQLSTLRDWLLPMLMNGQVRVVDEESELSFAAESKRATYGKGKL